MDSVQDIVDLCDKSFMKKERSNTSQVHVPSWYIMVKSYLILRLHMMSLIWMPASSICVCSVST